MACRPFDAKPLSEPLTDYFEQDPWEQISWKCEPKYEDFHSRKCIWKYLQICNNLNVLSCEIGLVNGLL